MMSHMHHEVSTKEEVTSPVDAPMVTVTSADNEPAPVLAYRNLFINVWCNLHNFGGESCEGQRVYVDEDIAYSGNLSNPPNCESKDEEEGGGGS